MKQGSPGTVTPITLYESGLRGTVARIGTIAAGNMYAIEIIGHYAAGEPASEQIQLDDRTVEHLYDCGLGPIVLSVLANEPDRLSEASRELLESADLTARVLHGQLRDTTTELLDLANAEGIPVVLLKGIAASDTLYRKAHHRTMGDIDVLVPPDLALELRNTLYSSGFVENSAEPAALRANHHHHLPTVFHPRFGTAVEIHTALFSSEPLRSEDFFAADTVWRYAVDSQYGGRPCSILNKEYAFCYTLAHWATDGKWAVNLLSISDMILFMRQCGSLADWSLVDDLLADSDILATYLSVFMRLAAHKGIVTVPEQLSERLESADKRMGAMNLSTMHWLMRMFPVSGRHKVAWMLTRSNALSVWRTLLEPKPRLLRLPIAMGRIISRRYPGQSMTSSYAGRLRTLFKRNY
jgi:Uncharacterised nucleotidyltransferase